MSCKLEADNVSEWSRVLATKIIYGNLVVASSCYIARFKFMSS
jgi:hypothetical protein